MSDPMDPRDSNHDGRVDLNERLHDYVRHPHIRARAEVGPVKVADQYATGNAITRFNAALAVRITRAVGTMACAYGFTALALVSLPAAIKSGDTIVIVGWIAQTLLQLVLLSVILLGQNIQAQAADKRAEATFLDAEAVLEDARLIQEHLAAQDAELARLAMVHSLVADLHGRYAPPTEGTTTS